MAASLHPQSGKLAAILWAQERWDSGQAMQEVLVGILASYQAKECFVGCCALDALAVASSPSALMIRSERVHLQTDTDVRANA